VFASDTIRGFEPVADNNFGMYEVGNEDIGNRVKK